MFPVIPAKAGIVRHTYNVSAAFWIPAFAGMTVAFAHTTASTCYACQTVTLLFDNNGVL